MEEFEGWTWKAGRTDEVKGPGRCQGPEEGQVEGRRLALLPPGFLAPT